jgi:hypothetical protein
LITGRRGCTGLMERRINIPLPADIHTALRIRCIQQGKTMAEVIAEALKLVLDEPHLGQPASQASE